MHHEKQLKDSTNQSHLNKSYTVRRPNRNRIAELSLLLEILIQGKEDTKESKPRCRTATATATTRRVENDAMLLNINHSSQVKGYSVALT